MGEVTIERTISEGYNWTVTVGEVKGRFYHWHQVLRFVESYFGIEKRTRFTTDG